MIKKYSYLLVILLILLLITNMITLRLLLKERAEMNDYVEKTFSEHLLSTSYIMMDLEDEFFSTSSPEEQRAILNDASKDLLDIGSTILNLNFLDNQYFHNIDSLARYIDFLSEKESLTSDDIDSLRQLMILCKQLETVNPIQKEKGLFSRKGQPSEAIIKLLKDIEELSIERRK